MLTMEDLSAGVQKIFQDAVGGVPLPMEMENTNTPRNSETDALPYLTLDQYTELEKEERGEVRQEIVPPVQISERKVSFQGKIYTRQPNCKDRSHQVYYRGNDGKRLHHAVWESVNGPVPWGYIIHHKDGNPLNNELENLQAVPARDHLRVHKGGPVREFSP